MNINLSVQQQPTCMFTYFMYSFVGEGCVRVSGETGDQFAVVTAPPPSISCQTDLCTFPDWLLIQVPNTLFDPMKASYSGLASDLCALCLRVPISLHELVPSPCRWDRERQQVSETGERLHNTWHFCYFMYPVIDSLKDVMLPFMMSKEKLSQARWN